MKITSAHASHPGLVRQNNEDCIRSDDNLGIYLLADGMGGIMPEKWPAPLQSIPSIRHLSSSLTINAADGLCDLMANAVHSAHLGIKA